MAVSGELICLWYTTHIVEVKASLLFLKYNTMFGDLLVRTHKILIATAFATVFFHMGKAIHFSTMFGPRNSTWKTGFLILVVMFLVSYAGCILPWTVLSPTLYTMVQTIIDTYVGGWAVFILLGGEKYPMTILARTLVVHILAGVLGIVAVTLHIRAVHFVCSSTNRFYTWVTADRPLWLPNEIVKELYLLYFFFFVYLGVLYKKSISWGSFYVSLHKFYYGGATNWNNLPASIEPEWYFWIFYFALASASSLSGGLIRVGILFLSLGVFSAVKVSQCNKTVETTEDVSLNNLLLFGYLILFLVFFNRSKGSYWHIYVLDLILASTILGEAVLSSQNPDFAKKN